jgi:cholesterol transport system auxiliary component
VKRVALLAAVATLALSGCVTLLPKAEPAQLYTLGQADAGGPVAVSQAPVNIGLGRVGFVSAAAGDRILTVEGNQAAYIQAARWVSPAQTLFERALSRRFELRASGTRLVERRTLGASPLVLDLDVDAFETRYTDGPKAAPTVVIDVGARLVRTADRTVVAQRRFEGVVKANANRVSAIVPAYDQALGTVLDDIVRWTDAGAASAR